MSKREAKLAQRKANRTVNFFGKVAPWLNQLSIKDRKDAYYDLLVFATEYIPKVHQVKVIRKAQDLYYEIKQQGR